MSFPYRVLVHWNEFARGFVARVPALPEVMALAQDAKEALAAARRAAEEALEKLRESGQPLPPADAV